MRGWDGGRGSEEGGKAVREREKEREGQREGKERE